jgi:ribosomal protein S27AE
MSETQTRTRTITTEKYREYRLRAEARHPEKIRARSQTHDAMKRGKLIRQPCEQCGEAKSQAHHDDYSKPLDVRWLCHPCHVAHHKGERRTFHSRPTLMKCRRGHPLSGENLALSIEGGLEKRRCRTCRAEKRRDRYQRSKS